jgi:hypothetical protein
MESETTREYLPEPVSEEPVLLETLPLEKLIKQQERINEVVAKLLHEGTDFAVIPGTDRPSLLKPGAERILWAFNCGAHYEILDREIDHDREVTYQTRDGRTLTSIGLYRFIVLCRLVSRGGKHPQCIGTGIGSASTLESKYISRPRDLENTVLKMAQKRALVAAVLNAFALSGRFTQDVEDMASEALQTPSPQERFVQAMGRLHGNWRQKEKLALFKALKRSLKTHEAIADFVERAREPKEVLLQALKGLDQQWIVQNADKPTQLMDLDELTDLIMRAVADG